jgi:DNA-binding HxlR family transcriptional regulator
MDDAETWFARLDADTRAFTEALREARCKPLRRFERDEIAARVGVLDALAGAWVPEILFALHVHGARRFGELKRTLHGVSSRVLTDKLRALEARGLVARAGEAYALTPDGALVARHLHPIVYYYNHVRPSVRAGSPP